MKSKFFLLLLCILLVPVGAGSDIFDYDSQPDYNPDIYIDIDEMNEIKRRRVLEEHVNGDHLPKLRASWEHEALEKRMKSVNLENLTIPKNFDISQVKRLPDYYSFEADKLSSYTKGKANYESKKSLSGQDDSKKKETSRPTGNPALTQAMVMAEAKKNTLSTISAYNLAVQEEAAKLKIERKHLESDQSSLEMYQDSVSGKVQSAREQNEEAKEEYNAVRRRALGYQEVLQSLTKTRIETPADSTAKSISKSEIPAFHNEILRSTDTSNTSNTSNTSSNDDEEEDPEKIKKAIEDVDEAQFKVRLQHGKKVKIEEDLEEQEKGLKDIEKETDEKKEETDEAIQKDEDAEKAAEELEEDQKEAEEKLADAEKDIENAKSNQPAQNSEPPAAPAEGPSSEAVEPKKPEEEEREDSETDDKEKKENAENAEKEQPEKRGHTFGENETIGQYATKYGWANWQQAAKAMGWRHYWSANGNSWQGGNFGVDTLEGMYLEHRDEWREGYPDEMTDDEVSQEKGIDRMEEAEKKDHEENANNMMSDAEKEYTEAQGLENQNHELFMDLSDAREKVMEHILNGDKKAHIIKKGEVLSTLAGKQGMTWKESLKIIADYNKRPDILTNGLFDKDGNLDHIKYNDRTMTIVGLDLPSKEWVDTYKGLQANVSQLEKRMSLGNFTYPEKDEQRIKNLTEAQDLTRNNPNYERNAGGPYNLPPVGDETKTWCNSATQDTSAATGVDIKKIVDDRGRYQNSANNMVDAMDASVKNGDLVQVDGKTAQELANLGATVIVGWKNPDAGESGHVATVRPSDVEYNASNGPIISNVGWKNEIFNTLEGFSVGEDGCAESLDEIKYYYDPGQKNIYDKDRINESWGY